MNFGGFMKNKNIKLIAVLALLPVIGIAAPASFEVDAPVDHVFTPAGFDSNDNAEVIITGFLPNLCYKVPKSSVVVKNDKISISVKATQTNQGLGFCADVIVPYIEFVNIGILEKGEYKIAVNEKSNWGKRSHISIKQSNRGSVKETVYANVSEVAISEEGARKILLKGSNPTDCLVLKEINILDNGIDTYSILPKMKQIKTFCANKLTPFIYEFDVPEKLEADKVLLHVRVMDGRSVNAFFSNKPLDK